MITRSITLSFSEAERTIASLLSFTALQSHCKSIGLQAPDTNSNPVYFGQPGAALGFLDPGKSTLLPEEDLQAVAFKKPADPTDYVIVHVFKR